MRKKSIKIPDSDQSPRRQTDESSTERASRELPGDSSNKSGKHSSVQKLAASRPEFGTGAGAKHVDGAFGKQEDQRAPQRVPRNRTKGKRA
jgi:hypothetical protein